MSRRIRKTERQLLSRRALLKGMSLAPLMLRASPFFGSSMFSGPVHGPQGAVSKLSFLDFRVDPHYPAQSPLEDILRLVSPGSDEFLTEKYAAEIGSILNRWSAALKISGTRVSVIGQYIDASIEASALASHKEEVLRKVNGVDAVRRYFSPDKVAGQASFLRVLQNWLGDSSAIETAEFQITSIHQSVASPITVMADIRYDIVAKKPGEQREERIGVWHTEWARETASSWSARRWDATEEVLTTARGPVFIDATAAGFKDVESYKTQMLHGSDYWRTVIDGACGIDVYGNNGVAAGDYDNDGFDDLYVCQPAGLPNRLYRNRGDGTFEDTTEKAGVGVLDNTSCALFADFQNRGLQDLLVVCSTGPLLFQNQGNGTFAIKRDAFQFAQPPQGSFTHAALADYDADGRLDIYFCLYSYYLGLDQYHYPVPYFDARNGPPNFLMHNEGNGTFVDRTEAAGLTAENDRYSFACAWGEAGSTGFPDLYVANDFGRNNLYRNHGDGTFSAISKDAHIEDVGAGMSACWSDFNNDGKQDIYVSNMWSAAGQRVSEQDLFHEKSTEGIRKLYIRHAQGDALYQNQGNAKFANISQSAGVANGRWAWSSDFIDFDHDGYPDLYVTNGYISAPKTDEAEGDLGSFFWRQVVGKSPDDSTPAPAYERGWQALNELIRSDRSWNGYERNVMFANNHDGTFSEVSGVTGLDFLEDSRTFALADFDHDGRQEIILKNRNSPQLRLLHNEMKEIGSSIVFRLKGTKSNRDGIGAAITVEVGGLHQTKYLQAGSGFLAQHSKEVLFGVGNSTRVIKTTILWPSGLSQELHDLPIDHRVEVEEGSADLVTKPFSQSVRHDENAVATSETESLPDQTETWLIEPLKAPAFSLLDLSGRARELKEFQGKRLLLVFWTSKGPNSLDQLKILNANLSAMQKVQLSIVGVNVDLGSVSDARFFVSREKLSFPVLFATEEVIGIYNIVYRYLFDRRRDLGIPSSFLIDDSSMILKVYQGIADPNHILEDVNSIPVTVVERLQKALPLGGALYQGDLSRNDFTYGVAMYQHGYLDEADASFKQVIAAKPDDPEAYYNLGTLSLRRNNPVEAQEYLEQTVKLRPNYPEAWNNLGMLAAQQGQSEEAIRNFQQSVSLRPKYAIALLNLGNVYRRLGNFDKAEDTLSRALELQPDDPETVYSLGMLCAQQGQTQQAADYLEKAIRLRPRYPEAMNNLGVLFVHEEKYEQAEEQFKSCIHMVPDFDQSYLNLARLYDVQNQKAKAVGALQDLLKLKPDNTVAMRALNALNAKQ